MSDIIYKTARYDVVKCASAVGEDGKYGQEGYAVRNIETGIVEHTTMILPQAIYQAQGFSDSLDVLLKEDNEPTQLSLVEMDVGEDVVPN